MPRKNQGEPRKTQLPLYLSNVPGKPLLSVPLLAPSTHSRFCIHSRKLMGFGLRVWELGIVNGNWELRIANVGVGGCFCINS